MYVNIYIMKVNNVLKIDEIKELLKEITSSDKFEKESAISWDGRNLIIRIPREIADILNLTQENRFKKSFKFIFDEKEGKKIQSFEIIDRTKPVKKKTKNVSSKK